jgi:hypothetical protein
MLDLEFDSAGPAQTFADFLIQHVWSSPASSPGLAGTPQTRILDLLPTSERQLPGSPAPDPARPAMQADVSVPVAPGSRSVIARRSFEDQ